MGTEVAVVVPWRAGDPARDRNLEWVLARYAEQHPDWAVAIAEAPEGPFNRAACIVDGAETVDADVIVAADADVWCDTTAAAVEAAETAGWAVPHRTVHRLTEDATNRLIGGAAADGLATVERPYVGHLCGGLVVVRRDVLLEVPPDLRFVGWGQEDDAWSVALQTLVGRPWRGTSRLYHLWHPPQERQNRRVGTRQGWSLYRRYQLARRHPERMRALIEEARRVGAAVPHP